MNLHLLHTSWGKESTLGQMYIDHEPECFTLEDEYRKVKVKGETRIPDGRYKIEFRKVLSPMTERYRKKYQWFTYHLHITNVKGFKYVYLHVGNDDDDTDACILVGDSMINNRVKVGNIKDGFLGNSAQAYERVYKKVSKALNAKEDVFIDIYTYRV